ncbi:hypothetical protein E4T44_06701 [Aureobasidium sp. EXF-8845]|nr:hypothetical protein E4T44_06701 [Aureobasidium sp. EXF-8845]KAI4850386.1 hypothetical protein E4T45_05517 [Aureobasidium sp. EXF-8846]
MTFSPTVKTEFGTSIHSIPLDLVAQQLYGYRVDFEMADPSSSPPMRAKPEPVDSLSPSTSVELHRRSKTGCKTCRRRKKKCDEARPGCQNCAKNNILCGGYEMRKPWRKGARSRNSALIIPELPHIISAVDDPLDSQLLSYLITHASSALNIYSEAHNPFDGCILDAALANAGLMHSLLCLSASCLLAHQPAPAPEIVHRHNHHFDQAVVTLRQGVESHASRTSTQSEDCILLQTILLAQEAIVTRKLQGSYRCHLFATQQLLDSFGHLSADVRNFARQFLLYHNLANAISCLDPVNHLPILPEQTQTVGPQSTFSDSCVDGILHGLLDPILRTRQVRDGVRFYRRTHDSRWFKDERLLSLAMEVETQLRTWQSGLPMNTPQYWTSLAYRQGAYVYLYRTIRPSAPGPELAQVVGEGLSYISLALRKVTKNGTAGGSWVCGVLLPPLFLLGCAAWDSLQRQAVVDNLEDLHTCNQRIGIVHGRTILEQVWSRMDAAEQGADDDAWDWESVMKDSDMDVLLS